MRIDWHVHINDPKYAGLPWWPHPVPMSLENALEAHRLAGLDRTVISNAVHYIRVCKTRKEVTAALLPFRHAPSKSGKASCACWRLPGVSARETCRAFRQSRNSALAP